MSKEKKALSEIHRLYKVTGLDQVMFGFVRGCRATLHTVTIEAAIDMFMDAFGLNDEEYDRAGAKITYNRLQKELKKSKP